MQPILPLIIACLLLSCCFHAMEAVASDNTVELDKDNHYVLQLINFNAGDKMEISINVENGGSVDALIMDSINYAYYKDGMSFNYDHSNSNLRTMGTTFTYTYPDDEHHYYLVVDNTDEPVNGASPTGTVTVRVQVEQTHNEPHEDSGTDRTGMICGGAILVGIFIAILAFADRG